MKKIFEEPKLCLEQFSVMDQTLTGSSIQPDDDETNIGWTDGGAFEFRG